MVLSIWGWTIVSHNANSIVYLPFSLSTHPIWTVFTGEVWAAPFALSRCPVWHFQLCWGCIAVIFVNCYLIAVENPSGPPCFGTRWLPSCGWPARRQHLKDMCFLREVVRFILTICCLFQPASSGLFSDPLLYIESFPLVNHKKAFTVWHTVVLASTAIWSKLVYKAVKPVNFLSVDQIEYHME